jgi:hypothetical protein
MAQERDALTSEERAKVASLGRQKLDERATAKRAWKSWRRLRELHSLKLSSPQMHRLNKALGGRPPEDPSRSIDIHILMSLLKDESHAAHQVQSGSDEARLRLRPLKPGRARGPRPPLPWWVRAMWRARAAQAIRRQPKTSLKGGGSAGRRMRSGVRLYGRRSVVKASFRRNRGNGS